MNVRTLAPAALFIACSSGEAPSPRVSGPGAADDSDAPADGAGQTTDAGEGTAVTPTPIRCADALTDAYTSPENLPALIDARLGDVVRCAPDQTLNGLTMLARMRVAGVDGESSSGATTYRIAYRTRRFDGSATLSSARIFLPITSRSASAPLLVAAHPTTGVADHCAPSLYETMSDNLVLPAVAHGYAVIAPDYAGLGTPGTHAYLDNSETGRGVLDAARALAKFTGAAPSAPVFVYGHSQGGGAALSAQALAPTYGAGLNVAGVVAFAPGWLTKVDVSGLENTAQSTLTSIGAPATASLGAPAAFTSLILYGYFGNRLGETHRGDGFAAPVRAAMLQLVESQCIMQLQFSLPTVAPTFGSLVDATFRQTALDCAAGRSTCAEPGKSYLAMQKANVLTASKGGPPVLAIQGLIDPVVRPSTFRCIADKLTAEGVDTTVCTDSAAEHFTVVGRNTKTMLDWIDAKVDGRAAPTCASAILPVCL